MSERAFCYVCGEPVEESGAYTCFRHAPTPENREMETDTLDHIKDLAIEGCEIDGEHHKQWYLEQILDVLGWNVEAVRGDSWEPGIAP